MCTVTAKSRNEIKVVARDVGSLAGNRANPVPM